MPWVYLNEEFVESEKACIHFKDLALQRAYGIFDFFRLHNSQPVFLNDHLDRFFASAEKMRLPLNAKREKLQENIREIFERNEMTSGAIRITLTGGYSEDGLSIGVPNMIISPHDFQPPSEQQLANGIKLISFKHQRQLPEVKTIDYIMATWLQPMVRAAQADDVLYYQNNLVSESPRSNFFLVTTDDRIITPANDILKGITRKKVIELARQKFVVEEREINIDEIRKAKEAFITSTTKQILPVAQIDEHKFGNMSVVHELRNEFLSLFPEK